MHAEASLSTDRHGHHGLKEVMFAHNANSGDTGSVLDAAAILTAAFLIGIGKILDIEFSKSQPVLLSAAQYTAIGWQQFPHLFDFNAYRPITGSGGKSYQNIAINALKNASGNASLFSLVVYDVTNIAVHNLALGEANNKLERLGQH